MKVMSRASILKVSVVAFKRTLSSKDMHIEEVDPRLASKNSEFIAATTELESTKLRLRFAEDVVSLMRKHVQNQGTQVRKVETARIAAEAARATAESDVQSHTASESALRGEVGYLTRCVVKLGDQVARMGQWCE